MRIKRFNLRVLLITLVLAGLIFVLRSFLAASIIQPFALLLWAFWRVLASVDTHVYWALAIVLLAIPALRMALPGTPDRRHSAYPQQAPDPGPVARWEHMLEDWPYGTPRGMLEANLASMLRSVVQQVEGAVPTDAGDDAGAFVPLPDRARRLLRENPDPDDLAAPLRAPVSRSVLPTRLLRVIKRVIKPDDTWIDETLDWMEAELDIHEENDARKHE